MTVRKASCALFITVLLLVGPWSAGAQGARWQMRVMPLRIQSPQQHHQNILNRPNRPGHIYGNTVRNMHYRGTPLPTPTNQPLQLRR